MSATTDPGNRSASEIEADVEQTRVRVAQTIDALRDSMSPGQLMDQFVDYARTSGGAEFTRNLGAQVRDNPLPVLLIGAGIGWMLLSNGNKPAAGPVQPLPPQRMLPPPPSTRMHVVHQSSGPGMMQRASETTAAMRDGVEQTVTGVGSSIGQAASSVGSAISSAASSVGNAISSAASSASGAASSAAGTVSGLAGSAASAVGSAHDSARAYGHDATHAAGQGMYAAAGSVNQFGQQVGDMGSQVGGQLRQGWQRASTEQPMLLGALGLALGALVGALLPRTQTEDRLMGETSDAVTRQLGTVAQEQYEQAKEVVAEQVGEVREKVSASAPSASSLGDTVVDAAQKLGDKVTQAAHDLGEGAKAGLDKGEKAVTGEKAGTTTDKPASV